MRGIPPSIQSHKKLWLIATTITAITAAAFVTLWFVLQIEIDVPDTNSPPAGNSTASINNWRSVGQTFVSKRNDLDRISVVLGVEQPSNVAEISFHIKANPFGEPLRTVRRSLMDLPKGDPGKMRPGSLLEQWCTFEFEPIPDSGGRKLYFSVEGKEVPHENTVKAWIMFHSGYKQGEAYLSEEPINGHVVFRAYSRGHVADLLALMLQNITSNRPGLLAKPAFYIAMVLIYAALAMALIPVATKTIGSERFLLLLIVFTLARGVIYSTINPPLGSPDEPEHFRLVEFLATYGRNGPAGAYASHSHLYYYLLVPIYWLTSGQPSVVQQLTLRPLSTLYLIGSILFTWLAARKLAPNKPIVPVVAGIFIALHPQLGLISASINNDNAANLVAAALTYLAVATILEQTSMGTALSTVICIGLALMTKGQTLPLVAISALILLWSILEQCITRNRRSVILYLPIFVGILAMLAAVGWGSPLLQRAQTVLSVLANWQDILVRVKQEGRWVFGYQYTSFWAAFLGESIRPPTVCYAAPTAAVLLGAAGYLLKVVKDRALFTASRRLVVAISVLIAILLAQWFTIYLYYSFTGLEDTYQIRSLQGRFLFPALPALALLVAQGWGHLVKGKNSKIGIVALTISLLAFDISALWALAGFYYWPPGS